jgi:glucuronate isomerase
MTPNDGLVKQIHAGSLRKYNPVIYERFGPDSGS